MAGKTIKILSELESGYDLVADKFSSTRKFMWRDLEFVKDYAKPTDKILDFGCGNGRLAGYLAGNYREFIGVDISQNLIDAAKQKYSSEKTRFIKIYPVRNISNNPRLLKSSKNNIGISNGASSSIEKLPFNEDHFDVVFSVAVFHHFPSKEYALNMAQELHRVLAPGGKIVITVWNLWQKQYLKYHRKSETSWVEAEITFKAGERAFNRYHHPFEIGELETLFCEAGFKTLKTKEGWNLLYIGEKLKDNK